MQGRRLRCLDRRSAPPPGERCWPTTWMRRPSRASPGAGTSSMRWSCFASSRPTESRERPDRRGPSACAKPRSSRSARRRRGRRDTMRPTPRAKPAAGSLRSRAPRRHAPSDAPRSAAASSAFQVAKVASGCRCSTRSRTTSAHARAPRTRSVSEGRFIVRLTHPRSVERPRHTASMSDAWSPRSTTRDVVHGVTSARDPGRTRPSGRGGRRRCAANRVGARPEMPHLPRRDAACHRPRCKALTGRWSS